MHLSPIERTADAIRHASNQIETPESRFFHSLFWFWNNNSSDDIALDLLKEGNIPRAITLLEKQFESNQSSIRSFSSIKNLSILHMALARNNEDSSFDDISRGLVWAGRMLQFDIFSDHATEIMGSHFSLNEEKISNLYVDEILKTISIKTDKTGGRIKPQQIISGFISFPDTVQTRVSNRLLEKDFRAVDDAIEESKKERCESPENARVIARTLCKKSNGSIITIRDALGTDNYKYQSLSDKLAEEIDQCGTAYYNYHKNSDTGIDPGKVTLKISEYALSYATSVTVQNEIKEGIEIVEQWIEEAEEREKTNKIRTNIDFIFEKISELPDLEDLSESEYNSLPDIALNFVAECAFDIDLIGVTLEDDDDFYLEISSIIVNRTINMCVKYANEMDDSSAVLRVFSAMKNMAMDTETADRFETNSSTFRKNAIYENNMGPIRQALDNLPEADQIDEDHLPDTIKNLINSTSANLNNLKTVDRELFLNVSSAVANTALGLCISYGNRTGNMIQALVVMDMIEKMEMEPALRERFDQNKSILYKNVITSTTTKRSSSGGCYIATMVYGDYDAPQVRILRLYRDKVMSKTVIGRKFIKYYYKFSPTFIKYFGRFSCVHTVIKAILDRIVRRLS